MIYVTALILTNGLCVYAGLVLAGAARAPGRDAVHLVAVAGVQGDGGAAGVALEKA